MQHPEVKRATILLRNDIQESLLPYLHENELVAKITEISESRPNSLNIRANLRLNVDGYNFEISVHPLIESEDSI